MAEIRFQISNVRSQIPDTHIAGVRYTTVGGVTVGNMRRRDLPGSGVYGIFTPFNSKRKSFVAIVPGVL
jgi:hypothetical protein